METEIRNRKLGAETVNTMNAENETLQKLQIKQSRLVKILKFIIVENYKENETKRTNYFQLSL